MSSRKRNQAGRSFRSRRKFSEKKSPAKNVLLKASVDKNPKGFAFLIFENKARQDAFVPPHQAERLFQGDRVEVLLSSQGSPMRIRVLQRRMNELLGRYQPQEGRQKGLKKRSQGWVIYERKRTRAEIFLPHVPGDVKPGDWIRTKLQFHEKGEFFATGEVVENFGKDLPASADIRSVAAEYGLIEEHSEEAKNEAKQAKLDLSIKEMKNRRDLRNLPFITIDGETARDFDDAVYVERNKSGFILWVAIADVSHYVIQGSQLDQQARLRGTSVYFPERAFHMLPRDLSENLCSLKPREPRFVLVAKIELDRNAKKLNTEMMEAVIISQRRATYTQIQTEWQENQKNSNWEYQVHFELYRALRKMRSERGSIDFELPEAEVLVEPNGEVISIKNRTRLDSHRLIEEFMICANEAATEWMMKRAWPFIYRIHEEPSLQSLEKFQDLAATVGVQLSFRGPKAGPSPKEKSKKALVQGSVSPKTMSTLVASLEGHPAQSLLNMALLRSMKQAVYSSVHAMHFGLASPGYTHFTSPIRRYPDLVVHRLIRMVLQSQRKKKGLTQQERDRLEKELAEISDHCSYRERLASDAERESIKIKQVRLIAKHLGDEFEGKVVGMVGSGMFIQTLDPYVEGLVSIESMVDDFYEFDEERMLLRGRRTKHVFKMGDPVRVKAARADIDRRQIDFTLVK